MSRPSPVPRRVKRPLSQAVGLFVRDLGNMKFLATAAAVLTGYMPVAVLDDFLLPIAGLADDVTYPLWAIVMFVTWKKFKPYRTYEVYDGPDPRSTR